MREEKREQYISDEEKHSLMNRLSIAEGQVRGIKQMVQNDRKCADIIIQISAIDKALKSLGQIVLKSYIDTCSSKKIKDGSLDELGELFELYGKIN